jgi:predicted nucleotidyltransferase
VHYQISESRSADKLDSVSGAKFPDERTKIRRKIKDGDHFVEVIMRFAVRKEDLPAVIASAERWEDDETDEDRLLSVVLDLADDVAGANEKIEFSSASAGRIPTFEEFEDMRHMGVYVRTAKKKRKKPVESPLSKKKNQGRKISLDTADRLFTGFKERLMRVSFHEEFGVDVALILLFGSYFRREPEVGDIDLAILTTHRPNFEERAKQLRVAGRSKNIVEDLYGPQFEVLRFLKNRSGWFALHEIGELRRMGHVAFSVVHHVPALQSLVERYKQKFMTGDEFLRAVEEIKRTWRSNHDVSE